MLSPHVHQKLCQLWSAGDPIHLFAKFFRPALFIRIAIRMFLMPGNYFWKEILEALTNTVVSDKVTFLLSNHRTCDKVCIFSIFSVAKFVRGAKRMCMFYFEHFLHDAALILYYNNKLVQAYPIHCSTFFKYPFQVVVVNEVFFKYIQCLP